MLLNRKRPNVHTFTVSDSTDKLKVRTLVLIPGINRLVGEDLEMWELVKNDSDVEHMIDNEELEIVDEKESSISKIEPKKAVKLVKKTLSKPTLEAWLKDEKRGPVLKAISDQINILMSPSDKEEEKESE